MTVVCARRGCRKPLPALAVREGDQWCSAVCCRIAHGVPERTIKDAPAPKAACRGCGVPHGEHTAGCDTCDARHHARGKKKAA